MLLNKNIILEILQSNFGSEVENMIESCIMNLEPEDLQTFFEYSVDYAFLDEIEDMCVTEYEAAKEDGEVCGILEVRALISGYTHWDGEDMHIDDGIILIGIGFCFEINGDNAYSNLELENVY